MPTDEERREVAARLRKAETSGDIGAAVGVRCGSRLCNGCAVETAEKLAAIMDPEPEQTCHPVMMSWSGNPPYHKGSVSLDALTIGCSECGCPWNTTITRLPNYCHNCGAKVIRKPTNMMHDDTC